MKQSKKSFDLTGASSKKQGKTKQEEKKLIVNFHSIQ